MLEETKGFWSYLTPADGRQLPGCIAHVTPCSAGRAQSQRGWARGQHGDSPFLCLHTPVLVALGRGCDSVQHGGCGHRWPLEVLVALGSAGGPGQPWLRVLLTPSGLTVAGGLFPVQEHWNFLVQFLFAFASLCSCSFAKLAAHKGDFLRRDVEVIL